MLVRVVPVLAAVVVAAVVATVMLWPTKPGWQWQPYPPLPPERVWPLPVAVGKAEPNRVRQVYATPKCAPSGVSDQGRCGAVSAIVVGKVIAAEVVSQSSLPMTRYVVQVEAQNRNPVVKSDRVAVLLLGGVGHDAAGRQVVYRQSFERLLRRGDRVLLFLGDWVAQQQAFWPSGGVHGVYYDARVDREPDSPVNPKPLFRPLIPTATEPDVVLSSRALVEDTDSATDPTETDGSAELDFRVVQELLVSWS